MANDEKNKKKQDTGTIAEKPSNRISDKATLLGCVQLKREVVVIPEWGDKEVLVREPTAEERDDYENSLMEAKHVGKRLRVTPNLHNAKARMAVKCIINEDGKRLLDDADAKALGKVSAAALNRIVDAIERLGGMSKDDVEDLAGNSDAAQTESSPSS